RRASSSSWVWAGTKLSNGHLYFLPPKVIVGMVAGSAPASPPAAVGRVDCLRRPVPPPGLDAFVLVALAMMAILPARASRRLAARAYVPPHSVSGGWPGRTPAVVSRTYRR